MTRPLLAVPNVSEGRDRALVGRIAGEPIDLHLDEDHNRAVLTYAGRPEDLVETVVAMVERAARNLDLRSHEGVHPRFGVVDVLPFVHYHVPVSVSEGAAHAAAERIGELGIPVHVYDRDLPTLRRALRSRHVIPDYGPAEPHPRAGRICVGVRGPLVAFNVDLTGSLEDAASIAHQVREPGKVRALAFHLRTRDLVQVSMNLIDPLDVSPLVAFERVRHLAGDRIVDAEIVGLLPDEVGHEREHLPLREPARTIGEALSG